MWCGLSLYTCLSVQAHHSSHCQCIYTSSTSFLARWRCTVVSIKGCSLSQAALGMHPCICILEQILHIEFIVIPVLLYLLFPILDGLQDKIVQIVSFSLDDTCQSTVSLLLSRPFLPRIRPVLSSSPGHTDACSTSARNS